MDPDNELLAAETAQMQLLPKVVLHEHLDGGLRVSTVLELADKQAIRLPATDLEDLTAWFRQDESGSLEAYLEVFEYTTAVM